jgi:hypothetical protein
MSKDENEAGAEAAPVWEVVVAPQGFTVGKPHVATHRLAVPGGWLYKCSGEAPVFVPTPQKYSLEDVAYELHILNENLANIALSLP